MSVTNEKGAVVKYGIWLTQIIDSFKIPKQKTMGHLIWNNTKTLTKS